MGDGAQAAWAHRKTVANEKKRFSLQLRKTEETGSTPLPNAEFRLTGNGFNLTAVSDEKGLVVFEGLTYGSYTITETKAPSGYVPAAPIQITIDDSNTYRPDHIVAVSEPIKNQHTQLTVIKWDDSGVETLNGAIFRIKNADGKYVIANGEDGAYIFSGFSDSDDGATRFVTENSGSFSLEYLPMGSYTLEEIKAPDGFIILTGSVDFSIQNEKTSVSINNTRIRSTLRLVKSDENGKLLPDVGFVLRNSSGGYVTAQLENGAYTYTGIAETEAGATRFITDARGEIALNGLVWGTYYLDEASAPDGLVPQTDIRVEVTAETHNIEIQLNIVNRIEYGELQFRKTAEDGKTLAGAVFKLELIKESGNEYSAKYPFFAVSDEDGIVHFENIPYGVYRLTEYLAPAGYEPNKDARYIRFGNASVPEGIEITEPEELAGDWINSPIEREYTVRKVSTDGTALSGAVFEILDKEQQRIGKDGLFLAVNDGVGASIKLPLGVYYLKEIHAPENYLLNESPIRFSVTAEGPNEITVENAPCTGSLRIIKADEKDNQKLLSGAEFTIYGKEDYIQNGANAEAVYKITTNADGKAVLNGIPFGDYAVAETKAPHGYELTREPQYFTVTNVSESGQNSGTNITLTFENELSRYVLRITKEDIRTGKKISGATFAVAGNGFYTTATVDASGSVIVEVPAIGTYYITELTAPEGYTLDPNTYPVEVTGHSPEHAVPVAEFISRDYPTAVRLTKVDENGKELTGAVFTLYAVKDTEKLPVSLTKTAEGVYAYDSLGSATELPAGNIEIFGLPIGEYVFSEMKAPSGYMNLGDIHFNVDADRYDQALEVYAENLPIQRGVAVCKETIQGLRLGGAVFGLFADGNGTPLREETTSASGYAFFSGLEPGSYVIREITPPKGYQKIDTEFAFTIDENGDLHSTHAFIQNSSELFFVLTVKNAPIEHGFRLQKISAANDELALEGAQFRILGNGINKTYVTGSDGLTEVIMLPVGSYTLTEQKAPAGYLADGRGYALEIKVDGVYVDNVKLDDALPTYTIKNAPQNFLLRIEKRDRQNRQPLEGVAFSVVNRDGKKYSLVTDQYGMTETIALTPGTYSVSEVIAAPGYELPLAGWSFTVSEGGSMQAVSNAAEFTFIDGQLTLVLKNEKTSGNLMINKYDAEDSSPLAGASFEVLNESGERVRFMLQDGIYSFTESADALDLLVTDARGIALLQELPFGTYTVREVSAPVGYEISTFQNQINITEQDKTEMLQVPNQKCMRNVKVLKQSAGDEQVPLAGATFALYKVNGDIRTFVEEATTGYDGMVRFTVPYGEYMIVETKAPAGYELSGRQPVSFVVDDSTADDAEFTFTFENERSRYGLAIVKQDAKDEHKLLAGAEFAITDSRGFTKIVTTGDDGRAVMEDLVYDDYSVQEIKAPEGYALNDEIYIIHKEELRHGQIIEVNVPDTYILGSVVLKKVDHEDPEKALEGAEFIVKNEEGTQLKWTRAGDIYKMDPEGETDTVEAGNVTLTELPAGQYTLIETKAPAGYVPLDEERVFSITEEQMSEPLEIVVENLLRRTAVSITKIDDKQHELRLSGAEFTLYRLVNGEAEETVSMKITNENGIAAFTDLTVGTYRLVETKAPTGYKLWKNPVDFKIDDDGKVIVGNAGYEIPEVDQVFTFSMVNEAITHEVVIQKISTETGDALPGAVFRITGNVEADVTTNENGVAKIELPYGEYQLQEIVAPDGYVLDQTIHTLTVNEEGFFVGGVLQSAFAVTIENAPVEHDFQLHKQSEADGRPLAGAEFTIVGNGKAFTLTTDPMGNTKVVRLTPGTYTITEKRAPAGYKRPLAGWTLTVEAGGTISVKGDKAVVVSYNTHSILIIKNSKETGYEIGKTGETGNHTQLLCGALLMIFSFIGLLILMIHDRHKKNAVCAR